MDKRKVNIRKVDVIELKKIRNRAKSITDTIIQKKITYKIWDIVCVVLIATLCNCDDWEDIELYVNEHRKWLRSFFVNRRYSDGSNIQKCNGDNQSTGITRICYVCL
ncbi:MAG: transposase family protein [Bacilli bacterium]|nr:transposase family protein [Bacilli bacterium]